MKSATNKGIVIPATIITSLGLFALNLVVNNVKEKSRKEVVLDNQVIVLSQQIEALKTEIGNLKDKISENNKELSEQFQEYKVRNNGKIDLISEKIYELNARADTSDKLGKKNSIWIDNFTKEMMRKESMRSLNPSYCRK